MPRTTNISIYMQAPIHSQNQIFTGRSSSLANNPSEAMSESAGGTAAASPSSMIASKKSAVKKKNNSFGGCLKAPFRLLRRARDFYVKSLGGCAGAGGGARGGGFAAGVVALMPRARSRSAFGQSNRYGSGEDDFSDLVRASSKGSAPVGVVTRSQSAPAIERIDEEEVYERSQSCAVPAAAAGGRLVRR